jgi:Phytanoyl-CoA dioxygenase (PhyH)
MEPLNQNDLDFFDEHGYVVLSNAIDEDQVHRTRQEICDHLQVAQPIWPCRGRRGKKQCKRRTKANDCESWYKSAGVTNIGFVELYHGEAMWSNRQQQKLYAAFAQLYRSERLLVSLDRCCFKPPVRSDFRSPGFVHWDLDPWRRRASMELQGVLALTDQLTPADGGFHCVPGFHRRIDEWLETHPNTNEKASLAFEHGGRSVNVPKKYLAEMRVETVPLRAGDMVIWRRKLPHGNGENTSSVPRMCQYITYVPEGHINRPSPQGSLWRIPLHERIECWRNSREPSCRSNVAWASSSSSSSSAVEPIALSELGQRLLGIESWPWQLERERLVNK